MSRRQRASAAFLTPKGRSWAMLVFFMVELAACRDASSPIVTPTCKDGVGAGDCTPAACGRGTYGDRMADVYVAADAEDGGDGAEDAPFRSIQAGADRAAEVGGGRVAIAGGTYLENISMGTAHNQVELAGRCREMVTIDGSGEEKPGILVVKDAPERTRMVLSGVTVTGGYFGLEVDGAEVWVTSSAFLENRVDGVLVTRSADVSMSDISVTDSVPVAGDFGRGMEVNGRSRFEGEHILLRGNTDIGLMVSQDDTVARLSDSEIWETGARRDGQNGQGITVEGGAALTAERVLVSGNTDDGVRVVDAGSTLTITDSEVRETHALPNGTFGRGVDVEVGAALTASRLVIDSNDEVGLYASNAGSTVTISDSVVRNTQPSPDGTYGRGIAAQDGASIVASHVVVDGNSDHGVYLADDGTRVTLTDSEVRRTQSSGDGTTGRGINVQTGATFIGERIVVADNHGLGVFAGGMGASVVLSDSTVRGTDACADGTGGRGIGIQDGATLTADHVLIQQNTAIGLAVIGSGSTATLTDVDVTDTRPSADGSFGRGLEITRGASLTAAHIRVVGNSEEGVMAGEAATRVDLTDVLISDTRRSAATVFAAGIAAQGGAHIAVRDALVVGTAGVGLYSIGDGALTCDRCALSSNTFAGALLTDGRMNLSNTSITDTLPDVSLGGGVGIFAAPRGRPGQLVVTNTTIGTHPYAAIWLGGPGSYDIADSDLSGGAGVELNGWSAHGNAVFATSGISAWDGASGLLLRGNTIRGASDTAVLLQDSSATFVDNLWDGNARDLVQQRCEGVAPLDPSAIAGLTSSRVCTGGDLLTDTSLRFDGLALQEAEIEP